MTPIFFIDKGFRPCYNPLQPVHRSVAEHAEGDLGGRREHVSDCHPCYGRNSSFWGTLSTDYESGLSDSHAVVSVQSVPEKDLGTAKNAKIYIEILCVLAVKNAILDNINLQNC